VNIPSNSKIRILVLLEICRPW